MINLILSLVFLIEFGYIPNYSIALYEPYFEVPAEDRGYYCLLQGGIDINGLNAGVSIQSYSWLEHDPFGFWPHQSLYGFYLFYETEWFTIGLQRDCLHPVFPGVYSTEPIIMNSGEKWYLELYAQFHARKQVAHWRL